MRLALLLALGLVLGAAPVMAQGVEPGVYDYFIHHATHGRIGRHRMIVSRADDRLIVEHESHIAVKFLFAIAYRREAHYREVWQDDRLLAFEGVVDDNGEVMAVEARAEGDRLLIDGAAGVTEAPAETAPSQPSHEAAIARRWFMKVGTGELLEATVERGSLATVMVAGESIDATPYTVSGDLEQEVWFDQTGLWAMWRLARDGGTITLMRE